MRRAETKRQTRAVELILEDIETESWRDDMPLRLIRFSEAAVNLSFSFRTPSTSRSFPRVIPLTLRAGSNLRSSRETGRAKEKSLTVETRTLTDKDKETAAGK